MASRWLYLILAFSLCFVAHHSEAAGAEDDPKYWSERNQLELNAAVSAASGHNKNLADAMILFIGDGMSVATVTGTRIWKGQKDGKSGEESQLVYDNFPHFGYSKIYNTNSQVPDSAGTATAYLTGVKTKRRVLGLDAGITVANCDSTKGHDVNSFLVEAKRQGLPVGIVTTTRITHASPAGAYAHVPERNWESDDPDEFPQEAVDNKCKDIAWQLMHGHEFDVLMGGGRMRFMTTSQRDPVYNVVPGRRKDEDLIQYWKNRYSQYGPAEYVYNREQFLAVDPSKTDFLLGLFALSEMDFDVENPGDQPTLAEMTEKAIQILKRKGDGRFALFVEGGRIDHGHHFNQAKRAITDGLALEQAIAKAKSITSDNTLMILSSDHSHTMSMAGYAPRGHPLFGKLDSDVLGRSYTPLGYYTGGNAKSTVFTEFKLNFKRPDITHVDTEDITYQQQSFVPSKYETHGGDDVAIFATGPWSHLIHSVHEQNYIPHVLMFAGCIGQYSETCLQSPSVNIDSFGGVQGAALPGRFRVRPPPDSRDSSGTPEGSGAPALTATTIVAVLFWNLVAKRLL